MKSSNQSSSLGSTPRRKSHGWDCKYTALIYSPLYLIWCPGTLSYIDFITFSDMYFFAQHFTALPCTLLYSPHLGVVPEELTEERAGSWEHHFVSCYLLCFLIIVGHQESVKATYCRCFMVCPFSLDGPHESLSRNISLLCVCALFSSFFFSKTYYYSHLKRSKVKFIN